MCQSGTSVWPTVRIPQQYVLGDTSLWVPSTMPVYQPVSHQSPSPLSFSPDACWHIGSSAPQIPVPSPPSIFILPPTTPSSPPSLFLWMPADGPHSVARHLLPPAPATHPPLLSTLTPPPPLQTAATHNPLLPQPCGA
ncbi:hypothetical protein CRENBAI_023259 [Crenichthys baileyi]|uniref:Uncharacterized protein n=1 Tax=Crenichthys baileyi TaxID=28760 RepID=A0AAV9R7R2_9TELE